MMAKGFPSPRILVTSSCIVLTCYFTFFYTSWFPSVSYSQSRDHATTTTSHVHLYDIFLDQINHTTEYFESYPLNNSEFGQLGKRIQILQSWISALESKPSTSDILIPAIERSAQVLFPFLPAQTNESATPLLDARSRGVDGTHGIIIVTGKRTFRYACHLVQNIRIALKSDLPIEVAFAGESDLPIQYQNYITSLSHNITTVNVEPYFNAEALGVSSPDGGWAVKPFAIIASQFSSVILLDADAVLLQPPESLFTWPTFASTGISLFHDRLLWPGGFAERHGWWKSHLSHANPLSSATLRSKVILGPYAEEGDSGLIVVDKSRLGVFMGLLHICWQNTKSVREEYTYKMGYGDKESWWFGFELSGVEYSMEEHYAAIIGKAEPIPSTNRQRDESDHPVETPPPSLAQSEPPSPKTQHSRQQICSFQIAHVAPSDNTTTGSPERLLWLNGSLLKNKVHNMTEFLDWHDNSQWMVDGEWVKNARRVPSCMLENRVISSSTSATNDNATDQDQVPGRVRDVDEQGLAVLKESVDQARLVDGALRASGTGFEEDVVKAWFEAVE